ncbi:thiosulfate/3-mercaptopyruvate sulfurtransferase [Fontimonas thermophila]|uniref:Thiosulfate/3-mercaptopyruvate sulfurtransferase n=1 Tax=Fontimonas thermophila TaxID=1076937 RepID=A0A1I2HXN3_9GAMM|nr:rhodanese-like domain-containing protein [Fontimonas thermophila]SFF34809.1 thiosulfate/3-mercaptopyruvate sulfurtransferase [Fontimonas thermophila]
MKKMAQIALKLGGALLAGLFALPGFGETMLPGPLVDAAWLKQHLNEVTVLDVRDDLKTFTTEPEFETDPKTGQKKLISVGGRIEGTLPVDFNKIRTDREIGGVKISKMLPSKAEFQEIMQAAGLIKGKPIVIASTGDDAGQIEEATRLYWSLKVYGEDQIAILDGGVAAWLASGYPVTTVTAAVPRGDWEATDIRTDLIAEMADVETAHQKKIQLIDARPLPQYLGLSFKKPTVLAGGHIAGAKNYPTDVRFKPAGLAYMFLSPDEYRAVMQAQGIDPNAASIAYCNTGHMASGLWFIQSEILGNRKVRLYDGSMHEWTTRGKPVVGITTPRI